jgi:acetyltransferase-like isoleucine patch superfamily enzyme
MIKYFNFRDWFNFPDWLDEDSKIEFSDSARKAISDGSLKFSLKKHGGKTRISGLRCFVDALSGNIKIHVGADDTTIKLGQIRGVYDFRLWRESSVSIGDGTTCNGARIVCDNSTIVIGEDCLFSDEIIVQSADQHGIVDLKTSKIINGDKTNLRIGDHVWIGRRANILYGADIGSGSIVGFGSLINKEVPENSLIVGVPGVVKKSDISWSRSPLHLDGYSKNIIATYNES